MLRYAEARAIPSPSRDQRRLKCWKLTMSYATQEFVAAGGLLKLAYIPIVDHSAQGGP